MQPLTTSGRLGLVLHPRRDPTPVARKLTSWARSHGKQVIVDARDAARLPDDVEPAELADRSRVRSTIPRAAGVDGRVLSVSAN